MSIRFSGDDCLMVEFVVSITTTSESFSVGTFFFGVCFFFVPLDFVTLFVSTTTADMSAIFLVGACSMAEVLVSNEGSSECFHYS
jgi:hypothetical protein